jgi:hypothetical protein
VPKLYRILALLIAAEAVVQAMAVGYFIAGLYRWMATEGRVGVADRHALLSSDIVDEGTDGVLSKFVVRSAEDWLDAGVGLTVHTVVETAVAPVLAVLLLLVAFAAMVPDGRRWAGLIVLGVALQVLLGLGPQLAALHEVVALAVFGTALYAAQRATGPVRSGAAPDPGGYPVQASPERRQGRGGTRRVYRILAVLIGVGVLVQAAALGSVVSRLHSYLTTGRGGVLWAALVYSVGDDEGNAFTVDLVTELLVLPALALTLLVVAFLTKVRGATTWAAVVLVAVVARAGLDLVGEAGPAVGAAWVLVGFAVFAVVLWMVYRLRPEAADPGDGPAPGLVG